MRTGLAGDEELVVLVLGEGIEELQQRSVVRLRPLPSQPRRMSASAGWREGQGGRYGGVVPAAGWVLAVAVANIGRRLQDCPDRGERIRQQQSPVGYEGTGRGRGGQRTFAILFQA